jgi:hypothetical protein
MKLRDKAAGAEAREDVREMAEALSLFGSAVRHMADRRAAQMEVRAQRPQARRTPSPRLRLVLAPALAVAVAVAVPAWSYFHRGETAARSPAPAAQHDTEARAGVNDTVLMNQIDSDVSEDVPDALEPLAQLSEQAAATQSTTTENSNVSQK